jgi:hypothetical protein
MLNPSKRAATMKTTETIQELKTLQSRMDAIRRELGINPPGEITYQADLDVTSDDTF